MAAGTFSNPCRLERLAISARCARTRARRFASPIPGPDTMPRTSRTASSNSSACALMALIRYTTGSVRWRTLAAGRKIARETNNDRRTMAAVPAAPNSASVARTVRPLGRPGGISRGTPVTATAAAAADRFEAGS
jgi:hypothetical protein